MVDFDNDVLCYVNNINEQATTLKSRVNDVPQRNRQYTFLETRSSLVGTMTKEDLLLPVVMGRLEIEPSKVIIPTQSVENPFIISQEKKRFFTQKLPRHSKKCNCSSHKKDLTVPIYKVNKKGHNRIIKEPTLKFLQNYEGNASVAALTSVRSVSVVSTNRKIDFPEATQSDNSSLHALVDNCNQLRISSDCRGQINEPLEGISESKWWKQSIPLVSASKEASDKNRAGPSCSQEALNPPCDVTIDELASYFETLVHIPKKMSSMAEMMYR